MNIILICMLLILVAFLLLSCQLRSDGEPMECWTGENWKFVLWLSAIFPLGIWVAVVSFIMANWDNLISERTFRRKQVEDSDQ